MKKNIVNISSVILLGNILIKGITFISTPIFTRLLNPEEFGIFNSYQIYDTFFQLVISFAMYSSFKNAYLQFKECLEEYLSNVLILVIVSFFLTISVINILPINISIFGKPIINLLIITSFSNAVINIYCNYSYVKFEIRKYLIISITNTILNITISILLVKYFSIGNRYFARIYGYSIPSIVICAILYLKYIKFRYNGKYIKFAIKFSIPVQLYAISEFMLSQVNRVIILKTVGKAELGIYSLAYSIYSIIAVIRNSFESVLGPIIYLKLKNNEEKELHKIITYYIKIMKVVSILLLLMSSEITQLYAPIAYRNSIYITIPLIFTSFIIAIISIHIQFEYYQLKTTFLPIITFIISGVNIVLNIITIPKFGYAASAYVSIITYSLLLLSHFIYLKVINRKLQIFNKNIVLDTVIVAMFTIYALIQINSISKRLAALVVYVVYEFISNRNNIKEFVSILKKDII